MRESAFAGAFPRAWQQAYKGQPWHGPFLAPGGEGMLHVEREAAMTAPFPECHSTLAPCFHGSLGFLQKHSLLCISSLPSPQVASLQPTTVILLDFLRRPCIPAPSPSAHWQTHILTCGVQGCCLDHLRRSHSVLSATDWSFHPYQAPSNAPLLSQLISPPVRGFSWMWELSTLQVPQGFRFCPTS